MKKNYSLRPAINVIKILVTVAVLTIVTKVNGQFVEIDRAKSTAKNLYLMHFSDKSNSEIKFTKEDVISNREIPVMYVFNVEQGGFVLLAADERIQPALGYASEGSFDLNNLSCCLEWVIDNYKNQIYEVITDNNPSKKMVKHEAWDTYDNFTTTKSNTDMASVSPMMTTTWSQGCYYNSMCPADASLGTNRCGRVPTGCVATAFAQVLKYHNFPAQGVGTKSYNHNLYGTLSANFAATTYDWASMPNKLTAENQAAATLLYHAGISINMNYGPNGSSAFTADVRKALVNTFKYASSAKIVNKSSYSNTQWNNLIKGELDQQRIVVLSGQDTAAQAGHAFICHGYQGTDHFFINWGWNGSADGYFYLNALSPSSYSFNSSVRAIIDIKPSVSPVGCSGQQTLTATTGTFNDGSGAANYADNLNCMWLIKPTNAGSVTLTFNTFQTEANYDFVKVYDGATTSAPLLGSYSGNNLPPQLTSTTGEMLVHFTTDHSTTRSGWSASYVGNPLTSYCQGMTVLTNANGTFSDGSGSSDYKNNTDCKWLISPLDSAVIKLSFTFFKTESGYDYVKVYDGATTSAPLLGSFSGSTMPPQLTSTSGKMLVHFTSDGSKTMDGWSAKYTTQTAFCSGTTTLTSNSGTISDGSGALEYQNNADCKWLINPSGNSPIKLTFTSFNTEANYDYVKVYNGATTSAPLLGSFSGNTLPAEVTASSGKMLIHFTSDYMITGSGWSANYAKVSKENTSLEENDFSKEIVIMPNPNDGNFTLRLPNNINPNSIFISDILGKIVYSEEILSDTKELHLKLNLSEGLYYMVIDTPETRLTKKIIITQ